MIAFRPVENYSVLTPFKVKRLFIDSPKRSLKCVLLQNRNIYGCITIGHSVTIKEEYGNIKLILERLKYGDHQWLFCVDLKMVIFFWLTRRLHKIPLFPLLLGQ